MLLRHLASGSTGSGRSYLSPSLTNLSLKRNPPLSQDASAAKKLSRIVTEAVKYNTNKQIKCMFKKEIENLIRKAVKKLQSRKEISKIDLAKIKIEHPREKTHGDYATHIAMVASRQTNKTPLEIGKSLKLEILKLKPDLFKKIEVVPPGFINFFLSEKTLLKQLKNAANNGYNLSKIGKGKKVIVDYSSPNIAKPFGIGHLRSTIIGQALYNIYRFLGYKTIGDNHLGDWGSQFGKLIVAIKKWKKGETNLSIGELEKLYVRFHKEAEKNPHLAEEGRIWFRKLEEGNKEARRIWKACVKISLQEFNKIYKLLGVKIDQTLGESFYEAFLPRIIKEVKNKGLAKESRGALVFEYPKNQLPPAMLLKSDGATTYFTRDLAAIKYRIKKWKPCLIIYEVGAEQQLHFRQLFKAVEMVGWLESKKTKLIHVAHGLYRTKTGKFSTRKGGTIHLEKVLNEAVRKAKKIIENSEENLRKKEKIARIVGIGAVKYNDLSERPSKDIVFDWEKILNLKGNSGPYLQYTCVRCQSVLKKAKTEIDIRKIKTTPLNKEEEDILRELYKFPEAVQEAAEKFSPNVICNFIFQLSQKYNLFYDLHPIIKIKNLDKKRFRLALTLAVGNVVKTGLNLLGISVPEKM